jgi:hypothetical protein
VNFLCIKTPIIEKKNYIHKKSYENVGGFKLALSFHFMNVWIFVGSFSYSWFAFRKIEIKF